MSRLDSVCMRSAILFILVAHAAREIAGTVPSIPIAWNLVFRPYRLRRGLRLLSLPAQTLLHFTLWNLLEFVFYGAAEESIARQRKFNHCETSISAGAAQPMGLSR